MCRLPRLLPAAIILLLLACGGPEPLGPTPLDEGIIVYVHAGFAGSSQALNADVRNLSDAEGPCAPTEDSAGTWNDCISSVRVLPGWGATLYGDRDYRGATLDVTADVPDLNAIRGPCSDSYNDCISSIRVYRK